MNILIYSHVPLWAMHHAETLELCLRHIGAGDNVILWSCDGGLTSCPANAFHEEEKCKSCRKQTQYSLTKILNNRVKAINVQLQKENITLPAFSNLEDVSHFIDNGIPFGELAVSQLITETRDAYIDYADVKDRINSLYIEGVALYKAASQIIDSEKIEKVYVWNGRRCSDGPVIYAALNKNIDYAIHISGSKKNTFTLEKRVRFHSLEDNKNTMEELYSSALKIIGIEGIKKDTDIFFESCMKGGENYPGFVHFAKNFSSISTATEPDSKINILIFTSSYWEFFGMNDWRHEYLPYIDPYKALEIILLDSRIKNLGKVVVRWHPNHVAAGEKEKKIIESVINKTSGYITHIRSESSKNSYHLLQCAEKIITFGSTIGVEAAYNKKTSILAGRSIYEDSGSVYRPSNHEELIDLLSKDTPPLPIDGALKYAYWIKNYGNEQFKYLSSNESWDFFYGTTPVNYFHTTLRYKIKRILIHITKKIRVFELLKDIKDYLKLKT